MLYKGCTKVCRHTYCVLRYGRNLVASLSIFWNKINKYSGFFFTYFNFIFIYFILFRQLFSDVSHSLFLFAGHKKVRHVNLNFNSVFVILKLLPLTKLENHFFLIKKNYFNFKSDKKEIRKKRRVLNKKFKINFNDYECRYRWNQNYFY